MTAEQLIILALLVAAFSVGWYAGRNRSAAQRETRELEDTLSAAEQALGHALAVPSSGAALERLAGHERTLATRLPDGHPLTEDFTHAVSALRLLAGDGAAGDERLTAEIERAAREAHTRFRREAAAVTLLHERR